MSKRDLINPNL